jgi:hypothetical protein
MRFSLVCGASMQNGTARWVITERAVSLVSQFLLSAHPARRERLRIESCFHVRFDFHDLSPFLFIFEANAQALRSTAVGPALTWVLIFMAFLPL